MALEPIDERHALQIQAGTLGRQTGHKFEDFLTSRLNSLYTPFHLETYPSDTEHLFTDNPEISVLRYVCARTNITGVKNIIALSTGALATSEAGKRWLDVNGVKVSKCKSDVILSLKTVDNLDITVGISTKQCNNRNPTNAQLYFTTAKGFCNLLRNNGINVSIKGEEALRQFCGDAGFRPLDSPAQFSERRTDPRRFFWEEINTEGRFELESILSNQQDEITRLLLQKAYLEDPFSPDLILHKTKRAESWETTEVAVYTIDELILLSRKYSGFTLKPYSVRKGGYRDPEGTAHLAPRFGIVQMQRGGQSQHLTQLQFNLEAGYFYKI